MQLKPWHALAYAAVASTTVGAITQRLASDGAQERGATYEQVRDSLPASQRDMVRKPDGSLGISIGLGITAGIAPFAVVALLGQPAAAGGMIWLGAAGAVAGALGAKLIAGDRY